ncbi:hypothetical protein F9C07_8389 [Aspergillus flavus]|uniref:Uncharacterized protein n=1 Tax=Aspergillus flavus (strain ATCC 200026 / FGSC A1120 / IAM 13836 / NRRL 3357 / JCM 12722 / SRRC 167) TaxID=332952 RepID=A0A7U2N1P9_ASPFN|nr:hypothetical protein F9C07_8389 [Aspergillus flavus]
MAGWMPTLPETLEKTFLREWQTFKHENCYVSSISQLIFEHFNIPSLEDH